MFVGAWKIERKFKAIKKVDEPWQGSGSGPKVSAISAISGKKAHENGRGEGSSLRRTTLAYYGPLLVVLSFAAFPVALMRCRICSVNAWTPVPLLLPSIVADLGATTQPSTVLIPRLNPL